MGRAQTVELIREAQQYKTHLRAAFVINRKIVNTAIGRDVLSALEHFDVPVLPCHLCQRVLYAESAAEGLSLAEVAPHCCGFDQALGVLILEVDGAAVAES